MTMALKSKMAASREVVAWNNRNRMGGYVRVWKDGGEWVNTRTRSDAFVAKGGDAVIMLEGIPGYYLLSRVVSIFRGEA